MSKSIQKPPRLSECQSYEQFQQLISIWKIATDLPKERQGAALLLSLDGEAQRAALRVKEEELKQADGIGKVLRELDKHFLKDKTTEKFKALEDLKNYTRKAKIYLCKTIY